MAFTTKEVKSPKLKLVLELEFNNSSLTAEEATNRISFLLNSSYSKQMSEFIVFLLRETKSSTWEMKRLAID